MTEAVGASDLAVEFGFEVVDGGGMVFDFGDTRQHSLITRDC